MRSALTILLLSAVSLSAQDTARVSHLERSANAKGYSFLSAVFAGVFASLAAKDRQHLPPVYVFTMTTVGVQVYSWIELKKAGQQQTKTDRSGK